MTAYLYLEEQEEPRDFIIIDNQQERNFFPILFNKEIQFLLHNEHSMYSPDTKSIK